MNKLMKNKNVYMFLFLSLILMGSIFAPTAFVKGDLQVSDLPLIQVTMSIEGDRPAEASPAMSTYCKFNIGLETYNATLDDVPLALASFADADLSSELFQTDGITRTYSDSYTTLISGVSTGDGVYQTLRTIPESSFSQYALLKDSSVYGFSPTEPFAKTVNDTINAQFSTLTYLNLTVSKLYLTLVFDRAIIDAFFASAKESALFAEVSEDYATNKQLITSMLDPIFASNGLHDIVYAPTNVSTYATDWSIQKETRAVLGLNASDTSFDNATKTASLRNLMIGYIGWQIAPLTTVNTELEAVDKKELPGDIIFGFEQTPTTYSIKMNVISDYTASPTLAWNMSLAMNCFGLGEEVGPIVAQTIYWLILLGASFGAGFAVALIAIIFVKDEKKRKQYAILGFVLAWIITFLLVFVLTTTQTIV